MNRETVKEGDLVMYRFPLTTGGEGLLLRRVIDVVFEGVVCKGGLTGKGNTAPWDMIYPVPADYPDRFTPRQEADRWEKEYLKNNPK